MFIIGDDGRLIPMTEHSYDSEDLLQRLIAEHPDLLAGDQINPGSPRRWLFVSREQGIPGEQGGGARWAVDHLFLDQDAVPTLVEVKRSTNTHIRREVVGQMLDYAANAVVYWPVEDIRARFEAGCEKRSENPDLALGQLLGEETDPEGFWSKVKTNLQAGKVRLLFVADEIPPELRRVVEFLNSQMDPAEVLALEIPQYVGGSLKSLVPRVIGQTAEAQQRKGGGQTRRWDEQSFFSELERKMDASEVQVAREIYRWAVEHGLTVEWGQGTKLGIFTPAMAHPDGAFSPLWLQTNGTAAVCFGALQSRRPFKDVERREELRIRLNAIPGVDLPGDIITNRYPAIPYALLKDPAALKDFLDTMSWAVERLRSV